MGQKAESGSLVPPVFAYGTLLPGQPNYHLWGDAITWAQPAEFRNGRLYDLGYYPMLVEGKGGCVKGVVFGLRSKAYKAVISRLDALEGYDPGAVEVESYRRVRRTILTESGISMQAWVYLGDEKQVLGAATVADGDWTRHVAAKRDRIESWWQGIRTVAGLHRPRP